MGLQREAPASRPAAGASGLIPAATWSASPGRIRTTSPAAPFSRTLISRYSALAGSTTSQGRPAPDAASSSARTVCDFPAPVAPQTNTCRFTEAAGTDRGPAGMPLRSSTVPSRSRDAPPASPGGGSGVTSNSGRRVSRIPGTSASGIRARDASSTVLPQKGNAAVESVREGSGVPGRALSRSAIGSVADTEGVSV